MTWRVTVLTIFPEMLPGPLAYSLAGKALQAGLWRLDTIDIRVFTHDRHRSVDDAPFGGGPGMIMRADVLDAAVAGAGGTGPLILLSPRGRRVDQQRVAQLGDIFQKAVEQRALQADDPRIAAEQFAALVRGELFLHCLFDPSFNPSEAAKKRQVDQAVDCFLARYGIVASSPTPSSPAIVPR